MIVSRSIDLVLNPDPKDGKWSAEGWGNIFNLLMHRLQLEIEDRCPSGKVLWPGLAISTSEAVDSIEQPVLRVHAEVEVQEIDAV